MNKKILLIGKTGQLGVEIMKNAAPLDFEIFGFEKNELNVTDELQLREKIKSIRPDVVINTSAYHVVPLCEKNPLPAMVVNFLAVRNLARICKEQGAVFVTYSTDYVFDGQKGTPYQEDDLPNPLQVYGVSKLAGEYAALHEYSEGTFIIRTCGLYSGKTGSPEKGGNFVLTMLQQAKGEKNIEVSSEQMISPTYAGDLSKATLALLNSQAKPGTYHLANEGQCSWYEFAQEIFRLANISKKITPVNRGGDNGGMKRPLFSALKNTKAKALGIQLPSWQEGLKSYFTEYLLF